MSHEARDVDDQPSAAGASVIAAGAAVHGHVQADGDVVVRGRVEGHVVCKGVLFVEVDGVVHADVDAGSVFVRGEVRGDVVAVDVVELAGGGRIDGDVRAARVSIADGAALRGTVTLRAAGDDDADGFDADAPSTSPETPSTTSTSGAAARPGEPVERGRARAAYIDASGHPPPASGLVEKTVKPRVFLRRATETGRSRPM